MAVSLKAAPDSLQLTLPPAWYAVPGVPVSLYYDNVVLTQQPEKFRFEVSCDIGTAEARRWTVTPADKDVGKHTMEVVVKDAQGKVLERAKTTLHIAPRNAGTGRELKMLIVGDSLTAATAYPNELARLLSGEGNPKWTMVGTSKPASAKPGVAHEGYGGWKWSDFLSKFDPKPAGVTAGPLAKNSTSPFLFAGANGRAKLDLQRYFRENAGGQAPDVVTFLLGINDCFGANPNDPKAMDAKITEVMDQADKLLTAFHLAAPKTVLAVGLTTPPNSREEGFEANYQGKYHRWGWKRIQHRLVQRMMECFGDGKKPGVVLVPTELNLDPVDGYPLNNGVHPNAVGYAQIGASFYAWLKAWLATNKTL
jgi:lysophospholipase L1-like esterase